jgi:hypothetical protein
MLNLDRKYYCKKTYSDYCVEGNYYNIKLKYYYFNTVDVIVTDEELEESTISFQLEPLVSPIYLKYLPLFYDYFYTEKEERQLKLKKLELI